MQSTMADSDLGVQLIFRHGEATFGRSLVVDFDGERTHPRSFGEIAERVHRLAYGLASLGVEPGDRVATFCWNRHEHLEAYFAVPCMGAVLHPINLRLAPEQVGYIIAHAADRVLIVDGSLVGALAASDALRGVEHLIVVGAPNADLPGHSVIPYEDLISSTPRSRYPWPAVYERCASSLCYTSGTTGKPKGVAYSHRSTYIHTLAQCSMNTFAVGEADRILLIVPMFHANAWGLPYSAWLSGADLVMPGPHLQAASLARLLEEERITFTAAVPTIIHDLLRHREVEGFEPGHLRAIVSGGSAVARSLIDEVRERWGVRLIQGWGMTETSPLAALSSPPKDIPVEEESAWLVRSGRMVVGVEARTVDEAGTPLPRDGVSIGELQVRGPWVTTSYFLDPSTDRFQDGWLRTGDAGTIDERGYIQITDRTKDLIKSGGEWISSIEIENELLAHHVVADAAVIAIADERWQERPLALIVAKQPIDVSTPEDFDAHVVELRRFLAERMARLSIPESWALVTTIPRTSVGKIDKNALRAALRRGELDVRRVNERLA